MQQDSSMTPLVSEIWRLQGELERANESIDDKLDKLENAGMDVVTLTQKLEDARTRIIALMDEIADLKRKEDRRARRLARARCQKCHIKLDLENLTHPDER
jgi:chromosome segregation ATPase